MPGFHPLSELRISGLYLDYIRHFSPFGRLSFSYSLPATLGFCPHSRLFSHAFSSLAARSPSLHWGFQFHLEQKMYALIFSSSFSLLLSFRLAETSKCKEEMMRGYLQLCGPAGAILAFCKLLALGVDMDEAFKELEEMRLEMEKLREDSRAKCQLSESLRRALDELQVKFQNVLAEIEKQVKEIDAKSEAIFEANQMYENLECKYREKESALQQMSSGNEIMKKKYKEKIELLEQDNKELLRSLDETNIKAEEQERTICAYKKEIEYLKGILSQTQEKYSELRAQEPKEMRRRDEMLADIEQQKAGIENQLKWKSEQFRHLEEAHHKIRDEFHNGRREWESEKSNLLSEVSSLQESLDAQIRVAEYLGSQLQICNQALSHEEKNQELLESLKEAHEAQINSVNHCSALKSLQSKFRALEMAHNECSEKLKIRDADWSSQIRRLTEELDLSLFKLNFKDHEICVLERELGDCHCLLMQKIIEYEEVFLSLMLYQSKFTDICCVLWDCDLEVKQIKAKAEERVAQLTEQLESKNAALVRARTEVNERNGQIDLLQKRIEESELVSENYFSMQKELASYKVLLADSSSIIECVKEKAEKKENEFQENLLKASCALDQANSSLFEKVGELKKVELQVHRQGNAISQLENIKSNLESELKRFHHENQEFRRLMDDAILEKLKIEQLLMEERENFRIFSEEKERCLHDLEGQKLKLEEQLDRREQETSIIEKNVLQQSLRMERDKFLKFAERVERNLNSMQAAIDMLEQNNEIRASEIVMNLEQLRTNFLSLIEEKVNTISDIQHVIKSYEQECFRLVEELSRTMAIQIVDMQELQFKNLLIDELDVVIATLQHKVEFDEKLQAQNAVEKFQLENELKRTLSNQRTLEVKIEQAEAKQRAICKKSKKLSTDREEVAKQFTMVRELVEKVSHRGEEVKKHWDKVMQKAFHQDDFVADTENESIMNWKKTHESKCISPSSQRERAEVVSDKRLPLKEQNFKC
ncbi:Uncharacterized protein AXF42_Ash003935 [Apostasia shenzhenica]|uniref:Uncharacterized protein n=1 Tax=Apostasia shenzhenica TaxID=1088818 RepID=A0A2I0AIC6_9ASPA|nr:Uncharacterized protein AXF42_Ash003935 [Apostasia shenzhenica]